MWIFFISQISQFHPKELGEKVFPLIFFSLSLSHSSAFACGEISNHKEKKTKFASNATKIIKKFKFCDKILAIKLIVKFNTSDSSLLTHQLSIDV